MEEQKDTEESFLDFSFNKEEILKIAYCFQGVLELKNFYEDLNTMFEKHCYLISQINYINEEDYENIDKQLISAISLEGESTTRGVLVIKSVELLKSFLLKNFDTILSLVKK